MLKGFGLASLLFTIGRGLLQERRNFEAKELSRVQPGEFRYLSCGSRVESVATTRGTSAQGRACLARGCEDGSRVGLKQRNDQKAQLAELTYKLHVRTLPTLHSQAKLKSMPC